MCRQDQLSPEIVNAINACKNEKWTKDNLGSRFVNPLLRDDVLELLDLYCTVLFFPLEDESNNGFHITGLTDKRGKDQHFVFINTAQTNEKQAFTAAHELGHIWKVDEYVSTNCGITLSTELSERIINRFAAELLMPKETFLHAVEDEIERNHYLDAQGRTTLLYLLKLIASLMNQFFVPQTSVILRLHEVNRIDQSLTELLLGNGAVEKDLIDAVTEKIIKDDGYSKLLQRSRKKWIEGLSTLLEQAEKIGTVAPSKIEYMRALFDINPPAEDDQMGMAVTIDKGNNRNDNR